MLRLTPIRILHQTEHSTIACVQDTDTGRLLVQHTLVGGRALEAIYQLLKETVSPFLPMVFAVRVQDDDLEVLEEYLDGVDLEQMLDGGKLFSEEELGRIAHALCEALVCLHKKGIIHRDLKPSNVMMTADGGIKLIDFNAARLFTQQYDRDTRHWALWDTPRRSSTATVRAISAQMSMGLVQRCASLPPGACPRTALRIAGDMQSSF